MRKLSDVLAGAARNESVHHDIAARGEAILHYLSRASKSEWPTEYYDAAFELAAEVDQIQAARFVVGLPDAYLTAIRANQTGRTEYVLPIDWWAEQIKHASLLSRHFRCFPEDADTIDNARKQALRIFHGLPPEVAESVRPRPVAQRLEAAE